MFNPKSKILKRYFKSMPFGLKEVNKILNKPFYTYSHEIQYQIVAFLILINKRQENLDSFLYSWVDEKIFLNLISCLLTINNAKERISAYKGISEKKRKLIFSFIKKHFSNEKYNDSILYNILQSKEKDLELFKFKILPSKKEIDIYNQRSSFKTIHRVSGRVRNVSYSILSHNDPRALYLDEYSDCCQGIGKAGHSCMIDGISNKDSSFLVFERKGVIFAQGWIRKVSKDILLIDSIEFKGEFNDSLTDAILDAVKALKKQFKYVYMGLSPNRSEIKKKFNNFTIFPSKGTAYDSKRDENLNKVFSFVFENSRLYSDARYYVMKLS